MGTVYDMRTRREKYVDEDYENHLDGWCNGPSINDKDNHYCQWCEEDRQRQQYEDTRRADEIEAGEREAYESQFELYRRTRELDDDAKAQACADAFKPLLWAVDQVFGRK